MDTKKAWLVPLILGAALSLAACRDVRAIDRQTTSEPKAAATASTPAAATASATATPKTNYVGQMKLTPAAGPIGSDVKATGTGFTPNSEVTLLWQDMKGSWKVNKEDGSFLGRDFKEERIPIAKAKTDANGAFEAGFKVPEGFGFIHNVWVQQDNELRNQAGFNVKMQVEMTPASGPPGTRVELKIKGMGWQNLENSWQVNVDNTYTGWMSSVTTHGAATGSFTISGKPGKHVVQVLHGWSFVPYLNNQQSPRPDREMFTREFIITSGAPVMPPPLDQQVLPIERRQALKDEGKPVIWTDIASGQINQPLVLKGMNLPAGQVEFKWFRVTGNRISGGGWAENNTSVGKAEVAKDGTVTLNFKALDDLGGPHRIEAIVDGKTVATTSYTISPSALPVENGTGRAGTTATLHLKGVGWTETANIYMMVYDGNYMGFACGFNSQGDIQIPFPLTGEPGVHFVELYPGIYKGKDVAGTDNYRLPQLTYAEDHPGERLPAFRFTVTVTE